VQLSDVEIRRATSDDADSVLALIHGLADYTGESDAVEVDADVLRDQLSAESPPFECLLAFRDDEAVGLALYFFNYSTWQGRRGLYLEDLFVSPDHRRGGTGRLLMRELARRAAEAGCGRFEWMVLDWNEPTIAFYRALGAQPLSDSTLYRLSGESLSKLARSSA
jgi:GNAT superfamily N-acetyltransferase